MKLEFDPETCARGQDRKMLRETSQKIRERFHCAVCTSSTLESEGIASLTIAMFGDRQDRLSQHLDKLADFCEGTGIGRVSEELTFLEDLESLFELSE